MWKIKNIYEADFGCEERQPGAKLKVLVELENDIGETKTIEAYDDMIHILQKISRPEYRELAKKQIELIANIGNN